MAEKVIHTCCGADETGRIPEEARREPQSSACAERCIPAVIAFWAVYDREEARMGREVPPPIFGSAPSRRASDFARVHRAAGK